MNRIKDVGNSISVRCYLEEYTTRNGRCARMRDKETNKKVSIIGSGLDKQRLLLIMSEARMTCGESILDRTSNSYINLFGHEIILNEGNVGEIVLNLEDYKIIKE